MSEALRELYRQHDLPIFQNRMYFTRHEARNCPRGDVRLVEDGEPDWWPVPASIIGMSNE